MSNIDQKPNFLYIMYNPAPTPTTLYFGGGAREALRKSKKNGQYELSEGTKAQSLGYTPASLVKIGITHDPASRFEALKKEYPYLEMLFSFCMENRQRVFDMEQDLHRRYDDRNIEFVLNNKRRTEWFEMSRTQALMLVAKMNNAEWTWLGVLGKLLM